MDGDALPIAFPGFLGWLAARLDWGFEQREARHEGGDGEPPQALVGAGERRAWAERSTPTYHEVGSPRLLAHLGPGALR